MGCEFDRDREGVGLGFGTAPAVERTRSRALAEVTLVDRVTEADVRCSLSSSEYSEHYEHRAGTRISGSVSDAAPTVLDWEIGG